MIARILCALFGHPFTLAQRTVRLEETRYERQQCPRCKRWKWMLKPAVYR